MKVLLIGSGGREHALAWKLAQSPMLDRLYAAPGNPGIAGEGAACVALDPADRGAVADFCRREGIGLVVIGPEGPLVEGLGDALRRSGVPVFGPNRIPAMLEGSKGFTKDLCAKHDIPTARYVRAAGRREARAALAGFGLPVVIKADGLAAGKGVVIAQSLAEADAALDGAAGPLVIEEFMTGEEVSFFALVDGETVLPFGSAQDHKCVGEGDTGPNTGGMGAYSPAAIFTPALERRALDEIVRPTVRALAEAGTPFSGILYAGLMLTDEGPKLVEYNVRFGDPECQALMLRLDSDLLALMLAAAGGRLAGVPPPVLADDAALVVVIAAKGYPGPPKTGGAIAGLDLADAKVFQAGTARDGERLVATGGRVLGVAARASSVAQARAAAYRAVDRVDYADGFCRRDIGWRELERAAKSG